MKVNISIVIYQPDCEHLNLLCGSLLSSNKVENLFVINNASRSNMDSFKYKKENKVRIIQNNKNLGYGKAHNIGLQFSINEGIPYHIVMNPDIWIEPDVLAHIISYMENDHSVGLLMPKIYNENGSIQRLTKLLPTPSDLLFRRFFPFAKSAKVRNDLYELSFFADNRIINVPNLSGCFMFLRTSVLRDVGLFDPIFFMYLEDVDLVRRIHKVSKTIFYPFVNITHGYQKGSYKSFKLLSIHIISAIKYFNKWGWFIDPDRYIINQRVIRDIKDEIAAKVSHPIL